MQIVAYYTLLVAVTLLAMWRGGRDERLAAAICILGTVATVLLVAPIPQRYAEMEVAVAAVDAVVFLGFVFIALRSDRYWPLWVAGIQLTTAIGHLLKVIQPDLLPLAYGAALMFWSYPILLIIAAGALRRAVIENWRAQAASA